MKNGAEERSNVMGFKLATILWRVEVGKVVLI